MLKLFVFFIFILFSNVHANEPENLFVISNGKVEMIKFSDLKQVQKKTINHHPKFKSLGEITYRGYLVKDILKKTKINPNDFITIVGKTGQFSIEIQARELLESENIIATHINGQKVKTEDNGLQIIYDSKTLKKYPHLKQRQFWCWWVRSFILDDKYVPTLKASIKKIELETEFPWPAPYGISSRSIEISPKNRKGRLIEKFKKLEVELLNGSKFDLVNDDKTLMFLSNPITNKLGAYSLHQIFEESGKVKTILKNYYYIKSLKVIE